MQGQSQRWYSAHDTTTRCEHTTSQFRIFQDRLITYVSDKGMAMCPKAIRNLKDAVRKKKLRWRSTRLQPIFHGPRRLPPMSHPAPSTSKVWKVTNVALKDQMNIIITLQFSSYVFTTLMLVRVDFYFVYRLRRNCASQVVDQKIPE